MQRFNSMIPEKLPSVFDNRLLLLCGATKCGSTSLFRYLADHPEIHAASQKETRFFLDADYPGRSRFRYTEGISRFAEYFDPHTNARYFLDATSDYMYAAGVPRRIWKTTKRPTLLFVLRNPVERFISDYRHALREKHVPSGTTLGKYFQEQRLDEPGVPLAFRALAQGHYHRYLARFLEYFDLSDMRVVWFENMIAEPHATMAKLVKSIGLDPDIYRAYRFVRHNVGYESRMPRLEHWYRGAAHFMRTHLPKHGLVRAGAKRFNRFVLTPMLNSFNRVQQSASASIADRDTLEALEREYASEATALDDLGFGRPPWTGKSGPNVS